MQQLIDYAQRCNGSALLSVTNLGETLLQTMNDSKCALQNKRRSLTNEKFEKDISVCCLFMYLYIHRVLELLINRRRLG